MFKRMSELARGLRVRGGKQAPPKVTESRGGAAVLDPHLDSRRVWNEHFGIYVQQAHQWRVASVVCGLLALLGVLELVHVGAQNKIVPYVVQVDSEGAVAAVSNAERASTVDPRVIKAYLLRFVSDWRGVTSDAQAEKGSINRIYALMGPESPALRKLNDYFKGNNPFAAAGTHTIDVAVTRVSVLPNQVWQVQWQEVARDHRGQPQSTVRMTASITVRIEPPTAGVSLQLNPLGVWIADLSWSQQI